MENAGQDFIVTELLTELKTENIRKSKLIHTLIKVICISILTIVAIIAGFLWYLNQYDFTSTETITASGVYALVDSEGNVIAQDLSPEEIDLILGGTYGEGNENGNQIED